jgi:hypothetical protein
MSLEAREACARAALSLIGYSLIVCHHDYDGQTTCTITGNPGDPAETMLVYPALELAEEFIATNTRITAAADRAIQSHKIRGWQASATWVDEPVDLLERKPAVGDSVHYVSYGTPGGEYGKECRAAIVTELTEVKVNEQNPSGDGICRQAAGLFVANPTGTFHNRGVLQAAGTFTGPAREACAAGARLPVVTCADLEFPGGTWHWARGQ